jgi:predicted kinase
MLERAAAELDDGRGAIVDATFQRRPERAAARALAEQRGLPLLFVECVCDEKEIRARLDKRVNGGIGPSDADWNVYREQVANAEPLAPDEEHVRIDTAASTDGGLSRLEVAAREKIMVE